jgi:integrase
VTRANNRQRGNIETLPGGGYRVRVYAGIDPVTKQRHYLRETVKQGPRAKQEAEKVRTRLLHRVDEKRNPRTTATVNQLIHRWLEVVDVEASTRRGYERKIRKHIRPLLGGLQVGRLDVEALESFYAQLRKCRDHCQGRRSLQHRTSHEHVCDEHDGPACHPPNPGECRACRRACRRHVCNGLADSSIRQIHWILSGALSRAVRWGWIGVNPAELAEPPALPHPDPQPPSAEEAGRLIEEAWSGDPDWGTFVWVAMTTGGRRGELCALRWSDVDLDHGVVTLRRAISLGEDGGMREKDTKTHQQRRVVVDAETVEVLREHLERCRARAAALGIELPAGAHVFSRSPDGSTPLVPDSVSQRYDRMTQRLKIKTTLHKLRHYSATELIAAGVDVRTVAGRLGHGGGGATTLRVYAAWTSEADQRAAVAIAGRMPARPRTSGRLSAEAAVTRSGAGPTSDGDA